jgi:hypothetical protein
MSILNLIDDASLIFIDIIRCRTNSPRVLRQACLLLPSVRALRAKPQWPNQDNVIADNYLSLRPACMYLILHVQITNGPPSISLIYVPTSRMRNYTGSPKLSRSLSACMYKRTRVSECVCVYKLGTGLLLQNLYPPPQLL